MKGARKSLPEGERTDECEVAGIENDYRIGGGVQLGNEFQSKSA